MRILDEHDIEIADPDLEKGHLTDEKILKAHHEAVEPVAEVGHYETVREYANGGKDVEWIIDTLGVEAQDAWDEYRIIQRYTLYTDDELAQNAAEKAEREAKQAAEELRDAKLNALLAAVPAPDKPTELPSRPGYKWELKYTWGASSMAWEEVEDADAEGTADKPIAWAAGMSVYANYFYSVDGVRFLCIQSGTPEEISDEYFEQF